MKETLCTHTHTYIYINHNDTKVIQFKAGFFLKYIEKKSPKFDQDTSKKKKLTFNSLLTTSI